MRAVLLASLLLDQSSDVEDEDEEGEGEGEGEEDEDDDDGEEEEVEKEEEVGEKMKVMMLEEEEVEKEEEVGEDEKEVSAKEWLDKDGEPLSKGKYILCLHHLMSTEFTLGIRCSH